MMTGWRRNRPAADVCDNWILRGATWSKLTEGTCVTDRMIATNLVFDSRRKRMLLVDGPSLPFIPELRPLRLWEWRSNQWLLVDSTGPRRTGVGAVAFDERRGVLVVPVLYGGPDQGMWEWDGKSWRQLPPAFPSPTVRQTYGLTYDSRLGRVLMFGGQGSSRGPYLDDLWSWKGAVWTRLERPAGLTPQARGGGSLLYDHARTRTLLFGGYAQVPIASEYALWVLGDKGWKQGNR